MFPLRHSFKAAATKAKAAGKKTAKKQRRSQPNVISIAPAVRKLLKDVPAKDLENDANEWISVSRIKLLAIARQVNS